MINALLLTMLLGLALADLPTNCTYDDTAGTWILYLGKDGQTNDIDCNATWTPVTTLKIELVFPNYVVDEFGTEGTWTMIYNQGFAIRLSGRKYFAFQYYEQQGNETTSFCHKTFNGWAHDDVKENQYPPKNWGCYYGQKLGALLSGKPAALHRESHDSLHSRAVSDEEFVSRINKAQSSWTAGVYKEHYNMTLDKLKMKAGGHLGRRDAFRVRPRNPDEATLRRAEDLPKNFDWRNVNGTNFVSPVRNQGRCGSCYAFASMGLLESRVRIMTKNAAQPVFSPQDVVACSRYSQGCDGGFPYLIGGMYAQDFGVQPEECYHYHGGDEKCHPDHVGCERTYVSQYDYVGGFYGGCSEALMRVELFEHGPITVAFEVYEDFVHYTGGIYYHTGLSNKFNPLLLTNHAVLAVGYGEDETTGERFWIVKNSWGTGWGEGGFFRIRRGTDECAIESIAFSSVPYIAQRF